MAAILCWLMGRLMPADTVWTYGAQAVLLSSWPWWMLIWSVCCAIAAWRWERRWVVGCSCVLLCGLPPIHPLKTAHPSIVVANVNAFSGQEARLEQAAANWEADIVVLIEQRIENIPHMNRSADDFLASVPRKSHHMAIYCAPEQQCEAYVSPQIGSETMAMSYGLLRHQQRCWVFVHAPPPIPYDTTGMRPYLDELEAYIQAGVVTQDWSVCQAGDAVILIGDLNAVPFSEPYNRVKGYGLTDRQAYSGLWRLSWPAGGGWLNFPLFRLDHLFAHPQLKLSHQQFRVPDSDHKALRVQLLTD